MVKNYALLLLVFFFLQCNNSSHDQSSMAEDTSSSMVSDDEAVEENVLEDDVPYPDGSYSATVDYYNPDTGTSSSYNLDVEVENGDLSADMEILSPLISLAASPSMSIPIWV